MELAKIAIDDVEEWLDEDVVGFESDIPLDD
jgi:hypothetical protein